jgi:hypothetical protein
MERDAAVSTALDQTSASGIKPAKTPKSPE